MKNKRYYLLLIPFILSACGAPKAIVTLRPEGTEGHVEMGREYITLSNDSIIVELGFDGMRDNYLVFDFVVVNRTPEDLYIDPSDFYYVLLDSSDADSSRFPALTALSPDRVIHHYDEAIESKEGDKNVNSWMGFLDVGMELLTTTAAFVAEEDPVILVDAFINSVEAASHYLVQDQVIRNDMEVIRSEKEVVTEEIIRAGNLPPGKMLSGYVFFPSAEDAGYYMFCFPLKDQLFQFVYNQRKVYYY